MKTEIEIHESQKRAILKHLQEGNTLTSLAARRQFGSCYLPARIADIKKKDGIDIAFKWIQVKTRYGIKRVKEYSIAS